MARNKISQKQNTWDVGNIALFGAILMSHGITGRDKEFLKRLMYEALKPNGKKQIKPKR